MSIKQLDAVQAYQQATNKLKDAGLTGRDGDDGMQGNSVFTSLVNDAVGDVQKAASTMEVTAAKSLVDQADMVDVVTAVSNAEMVVNTVVTVRDKVISAYNDILKMPI